MSATTHEWEGAGAAGAETAGERRQGWSVASVEVSLAALPLVGATGADAFFALPEAVPPLLVALGIVVVGGALRRSAFPPGDVAIIAGWVAATAFGLGFVVGHAALNFLHTVTGRVSAAGFLGLATFDPTTHDASAANTLTALFDVVVELREADDGSREVRAVGHPGTPRTWQPF